MSFVRGSVGVVVFFALAGVACGGVLDVGDDAHGSQAPGDDGSVMPGTITGRFVVFGDGVAVSENARDWRKVQSPAADLRAAAVQGTNVVVIDSTGHAYLSADQGETWSGGVVALPLEPNQAVDVAWDGREFVVVSGGWKGAASATSPDGVTWTAITAPDNYMFDLAFRTPGGARAASHYASDLMTPALWELEGGAWKLSGAPHFVGSRPEGFMAATFAPDLGRTFGVAGASVFDTADGETWSEHPVDGLDGFRLRAVAAGGGRVVTIGEGGGAWASTDRVAWSRGDINDGGFYYSLAYGNGLFVAAGRVAIAPEAQGVTSSVQRTVEGSKWLGARIAGMSNAAGIVFVSR